MPRLCRSQLMAAVLTVISSSSFLLTAEPGWSPVIVARGPYRQQIESTPMHLRPNRPLHFYGNTVRRQYYRGNPLPMPRDISQTVRVLLNGSTISPAR